MSIERQNQYLHFLVGPSFLSINRLFFLFENESNRIIHLAYYLPKSRQKDYNFMADGQYFFDQPVKSDMITYDSIQNCNKSKR